MLRVLVFVGLDDEHRLAATESNRKDGLGLDRLVNSLIIRLKSIYLNRRCFDLTVSTEQGACNATACAVEPSISLEHCSVVIAKKALYIMTARQDNNRERHLELFFQD